MGQTNPPPFILLYQTVVDGQKTFTPSIFAMYFHFTPNFCYPKALQKRKYSWGAPI